jgi:hypothetical protein
VIQQHAGNSKHWKRRGVNGALKRSRGPKRRGKDDNTKRWEERSRKNQTQERGQQESNLELQSKEVAALPNPHKPL